MDRHDVAEPSLLKDARRTTEDGPGSRSKPSVLLPQILLAIERFYNSYTSFARGRGACSRLIKWGMQNLVFTPPIIRCDQGVLVEYAPEVVFDVVVRELALSRSFEPLQTKLMQDLVPEEGVFIDVGANIGYFSILASKWVGPRGTVFSFEPVEPIYRLLCRNLLLNRTENVLPFGLACFSCAGEMKIARYEDSAKSHLTRSENVEGDRVEVITLDEFLDKRKLSRLDFIKIDAEGADFEVVKGSRKIIATFKPSILLETVHLNRFGANTEAVLEYLKPLGYSFSEIQNEHSSDLLCLPAYR